MCKVIAVVNQKGGVGKTTTCLNLSAALSKKKMKVLVIDCDSQGHVSKYLGYKTFKEQYTLKEILMQVKNEQEISNNFIYSETEQFEFLPSNKELVLVEPNVANYSDKDYLLKDFVSTVKEQFDYIILDCAPSLNLLTKNALVACDGVLIPMQAQESSMAGIDELLFDIKRLKRRLNPEISILGVLITMLDERTNYNKDIEISVRTALENKINVFQTNIPRSVRAEELPSIHKSIFHHAPKSKVAVAYENLAKEVLACE